MAVGTFYNYYENKEEIFCEVIKETWNFIFSKLKEESTFLGIVKVLYFSIKTNKGFGITLKAIPIEKANKVNSLYFNIIDDVGLMLKKFISKEYRNNPRRLSQMLFMTIILYIESYENEDDNNMDFIMKSFSRYVI